MKDEQNSELLKHFRESSTRMYDLGLDHGEMLLASKINRIYNGYGSDDIKYDDIKMLIDNILSNRHDS